MNNNYRGRSGYSNHHSNSANIKCYRCGSYGHMGKNCPRYGDKANVQRANANNALNKNYNDPKSDTSAYVGSHAMLLELDNDPEINNMNNSVEFLLDSGCTDHITNRKNLLENTYISKIQINVAKKGESVTSELAGEVNVGSKTDFGNCCAIKLKDVLFVSGVRRNLLSMAKILLSGYRIEGEGKTVYIMTPNEKKIIAVGRLVNNLIVVDLSLIHI